MAIITNADYTTSGGAGSNNYLGEWDASINSPSLSNGVGNAGDYYNVSIAGSVDFGAGSIAFSVNDHVAYSGAIWYKLDNSWVASEILTDGSFVQNTNELSSNISVKENLQRAAGRINQKASAVNNISSVSGNISLNADNIPSGTNNFFVRESTDLTEFTVDIVNNLGSRELRPKIGDSVSGVKYTHLNDTLKTTIDNKLDKNTTITGATKTKITYDSKGLVTSGADATTTDILEGTNLYFTDTRAKTASVQDIIVNGVVDKAPSQNAVFDALSLKANDNAVVHNTGNESISGIKTFTSAPNLSSLTASTILELDASKNIISANKNTAYNRTFETVPANILMDGTASVGVSNNAVRADHRHPSDTTKQNTITGAASTITTSDLTVSTIVTSDASGKIASSGVSSTQLSTLDAFRINNNTNVTNGLFDKIIVHLGSTTTFEFFQDPFFRFRLNAGVLEIAAVTSVKSASAIGISKSTTTFGMPVTLNSNITYAGFASIAVGAFTPVSPNAITTDYDDHIDFSFQHNGGATKYKVTCRGGTAIVCEVERTRADLVATLTKITLAN